MTLYGLDKNECIDVCDRTVQDNVRPDENESPIGKWEAEKKLLYIDNIDIGKIENLKTNVDNMSVEDITNDIKNIMVNSAIITFPKKPVNRRTVTARKKAAVWYRK